MTGLHNALQRAVLVLAPHGGQKGARRNAWAGMSADAAMARARREAQLAVAVAQPGPTRAAR